MRSRLLAACAAALVTLSVASRARAEYVTLIYDGRTANPDVAVKLNGTSYDGNTNPKISTGPFYWHENELPPNTAFPPPTTTFCIEINPASQPLPPTNPPTATDFAVVPLSGPNALAISELYGRFYNNEAGVNWENKSTFNGDTASTAFQVALWELIYDTDKNLSTGNFQANNLGAVSTTAQSYLNALNGDTSMFNSRFSGSQLVELLAPAGGNKSQDNIQDQITLVPKAPGVPAPPGVLLAGMGFIALLGGRTRWLRRKAPATV